MSEKKPDEELVNLPVEIMEERERVPTELEAKRTHLLKLIYNNQDFIQPDPMQPAIDACEKWLRNKGRDEQQK